MPYNFSAVAGNLPVRQCDIRTVICGVLQESTAFTIFVIGKHPTESVAVEQFKRRPNEKIRQMAFVPVVERCGCGRNGIRVLASRLLGVIRRTSARRGRANAPHHPCDTVVRRRCDGAQTSIGGGTRTKRLQFRHDILPARRAVRFGRPGGCEFRNHPPPAASLYGLPLFPVSGGHCRGIETDRGGCRHAGQQPHLRRCRRRPLPDR